MPGQLFFFLITTNVVAFAGEWRQLASLPDREGFAGAYAGVSGGALIVAGGANFPNKKPWEGGQKVWHDQVFVLETPDGKWKTGGRLARPLAYGVSVTQGDRILCVGGSDMQRHYAAAFQLQWRGGKLHTTDLPPLPISLANACGALVGDRLFVFGGQATPNSVPASRRLWQLDLAAPTLKWVEAPPFPHAGRVFAAAAGMEGKFWLVGGAEVVADKAGASKRRYCRDLWNFAPDTGWVSMAEMPQPIAAAPSPLVVSAQGFYVLGGDDGSQVAASPERHRGFRTTALFFNLANGTWTEAGRIPASRVTTPCVHWNAMWVVPSGEVRPGIRSAEVWALQ